MPATVVANSMGTPQPDNGSEPIVQKPGQKGQKPGVPAGKSGGEINLSRAEAAALLVFETEDEKGSMKRAQEESGLNEDPHDLWPLFSDGVRRRCPLEGV